MISEINENEFEEKVLKSKGWTVVDFYASWCSPCKMLSSVIKELAEERKDVNFIKINVDNAPTLTSSLGIESIPVLMVYYDGVKKHHVVGFQDADSIKSMLK